MSSKIISHGSDWDFDLLGRFDQVIGRIAGDFGLDTYPNQLEVISAEQMMDAYSSVGMPVGYHHWSYGKQFLSVEKRYQRGQMGLAYEIVINSNPCIAYLMEENSLAMQALVIAHASYGHNSFFKGNYLFKTWTSADAIIDYLLFARRYLADCESRYGLDAVEELLDSCHALMNYGVDSYKRPPQLSAGQEESRQRDRAQNRQEQVNDLWRTLPPSKQKPDIATERHFPIEPQENLLYFIEKHAPLLEPWQREVIRIVRKLAQYFFPQRQTQVMNEGWATFWHYTIINQLYDEGYVNDGFMLEVLSSHTNVVRQLPFDHPHYSGINPYALGFAMMSDLRKICESPTREDREWFPDIAGGDWRKVLQFAMRQFKDESFILQYLSPRLIRDFHLFSLTDHSEASEVEVDAIHDEHGYRGIRRRLAQQYELGFQQPHIMVYRVDHRGDRSLHLRHYRRNNRPLEHHSAQEVMKHIGRLWGFSVALEELNADEHVAQLREWPELA